MIMRECGFSVKVKVKCHSHPKIRNKYSPLILVYHDLTFKLTLPIFNISYMLTYLTKVRSYQPTFAGFARGDPQEHLKSGHRCIPAIETKDEFIKISV